MADVEDPNDDGSGMVEAEATECSRCMLMWLMVFLFLAFLSISPLKSDEYPVAANLVGLLALFPAGWAAVIFVMLAMEWYNGNPEGERTADRMIQSDRGMLRESIRQYWHRIGGGN